VQLKKLAVVRSATTHACPFGLSIDVACKNAGSSVLQMKAIDGVEPERVKLQQEHNIAVYSMAGEGRCLYADKIMPNHVVNCDWGDSGAGIRDFPLPTSPGYPRAWGSVGLTGYYSLPMSDYWSNPAIGQVFGSIFTSYAETGEIRFNKTAWFCRPDAELLKVIELCEFGSDQ
jgi:hypothetical protein